MPVYSVTVKTGRMKAAAAVSPRVVIATDATDVEQIPEAVRRAADFISTEDSSPFGDHLRGGDANGIITWIQDEQLLLGSSEELRRVFLSGNPVRTFLPVHLPCLAEADLISLQPRLFTSCSAKETVNQSCRIVGAASLSALARNAFKNCDEPWARLHEALLLEQTPGAGLGTLKQIWQSKKLTPVISSLVLRNLIVALIRKKQFEKAEELLTLGRKAYPAYGELLYLSGVLWMHRQKPSKAFADLERAMQCARSEFVGSGGECSYRVAWLLGMIYEQMGDEARAANGFLAGVLQRPAFAPSVAGILRQKFSRFRAEQLSLPLCELVRREPQYLEPIFEFLIKQRLLNPPRRLLRTLPLPPDLTEKLHVQLASAEKKIHAMPRVADEKPGVNLQGPFLTVSGHARINRALGCALLDSNCFDAALEQTEPASADTRNLTERRKINQGLGRISNRLDLTIRHCWPPDFRRPESGGLACILPWEHHAVPRAWVREIGRNSVDELWVPSRFVAQAFIDGGVKGDRIHVIPNGFAPSVFNRDVKPWRPTGCRECVFLFVGGTIRRKGADLLLQAYSDAFSSDDDVTLIFKDTGSSGFYQHNNFVPQIRAFARKTRAPHALLLTDPMDDAALASLYRGCDALVLPYRGEGFGMPLIEAMACGKPVITTAAGPALEFCSADWSYLISAQETAVPDPPPPFGGFTSEWRWFEPSLPELASALRAVYENRDEAARRGTLAETRIAQTHIWEKITQTYLTRIAQIIGLQALAAIPEPSPELHLAELGAATSKA